MLRNIKIVLTLFFIGIIIGVAGYIGWMLNNKSGFFVNTSRASVLKEMKKLDRLETAVFTFEKIVDAGNGSNSNPIQEFLFGDKILMIAHGEVFAGFDLSKISENDIVVDGTKLTIKLPAPEVLHTRLDNEQTKIYDRKTGILNKGDKDLESAAREQAEKSIRDAACQANILHTASENGRRQLTALFSAMQFTQVNIEAPEGTCK